MTFHANFLQQNKKNITNLSSAEKITQSAKR